MSLEEQCLTSDAELFLLGLDYLAWGRGFEVGERKWRTGSGRRADRSDPYPTNDWKTLVEWLSFPLSACATLLEAACEGMPLRQFLDTILASVPASREGARTLAAARIRLSRRWTYLYELDCQGVASLLRQAEALLLRMVFNEEDHKDEARDEDECHIRDALAREPVPFVYRRRVYHFPYLQSVLLSLLRDGERRTVPELIDELWLGSWRKKLPQCKNRLHQLQRDTNAALLGHRLPFEVVRPAPNYLRLVRKKTKR